MAGLDPAIHVFFLNSGPRRGCPAQGRAWRRRETRPLGQWPTWL